MDDQKSKEQALKARVAGERAEARKDGKKRVRFLLAVHPEAVELALAAGRGQDAFAVDMGLSKTALQKWVKASRRPAVAFYHVKVEAARTDKETEPFDGTGLCLFAKRLSAGQFLAPWKMGQKQISLSELALFIEAATAVRQRLSPPVLRKADLKMMPVETETLCG